MQVSAQLIKTVFPRCAAPAEWAAALSPALVKYDISTEQRLSSFLAQCAYESGQFNKVIENLNYSTPRRLTQVWPKKFPSEASARPFLLNETKLANFVYARRLGNGDETSGDGFRYRGRGIIQITGRSNYSEAAVALGVDLVQDPDQLVRPNFAAMSAAWFWKSRGLNALADDGTDDDDLRDFSQITRIVNGGLVGLLERLAMLKKVESNLA